MNMTIEQIRERKVRAETEICAALNRFVAATEVAVDRIELETFRYHELGSRQPKNVLVGVAIKTEPI